MSTRERHHQLQPAIVAWYHPTNPNGVISAAQYPHVLEKNKVGYVPCIVDPEYVHILSYEEKARMEDGGEWRKCRAVYATHSGAQKLIDGMPQDRIRNVSIVGSLLHA
jgi:hypothetical protein